MTDKFPKGPYLVANVHEADDMSAEEHHDDTLGIYAKDDFDNKDECPSALAFMNHNWGGVENIAALLAAAPSLLEALEAMVEAMVRYVDSVECDDVPFEHREMMRRARAAITSARGEG